MKQMVKSDPFTTLAQRVQSAREEERERMARDLHDAMGASLAALKFESERIARSLDQKLASSLDVEVARVLQRVRVMSTLIDEAIEATRDLVRDHHPRMLRERGLLAALENHACRFSRRTGIACTVTRNQDVEEPPPAIALALFRNFQEALTNTQRHARASRVVVRIEATPTHTVLEILDDGRGFSTRAQQCSFGLSNMRERMRLLGGSCDIESQAGRGTRIRLCVSRIELSAAMERRYSS